jgi:predicted membrane protein
VGRTIVGIILIMIGLSTLLDINIWHYFWPILLIVIGLYIVLGKSGHEHHVLERTKEDQLHYSAVFQGIDKKITSEDFRGGKIDTVFGGVNLDLKNAKIRSKNPVLLKVDAILGGIKIMVPRNWEVQNSVSGIVGGVHDTTVHPVAGQSQGKLRITGSAIMGGVEITN